jgi:hypothetical protein
MTDHSTRDDPDHEHDERDRARREPRERGLDRARLERIEPFARECLRHAAALLGIGLHQERDRTLPRPCGRTRMRIELPRVRHLGAFRPCAAPP